VASDAEGTAGLIARLYDELRALARVHLRREREGHTLSTTALVNEAYLRLANQGNIDPRDRTRFFSIASTTMRRVLVDHARRRLRLKRGEGVETVPLEEADVWLTEGEADELVALDQALDRLAALDGRASAVVQHRFFGGLSLDETAELLGVSKKTVQRDWLTARAWLRREVERDLRLVPLEA
jgi:RNA polymerase sigma-70 factor, ECF subfamily